MLKQNIEDNIKKYELVVASIIIIGLMSAYLFYRLGLFSVWNNLAYFETAILLCAGFFLLTATCYLLLTTQVKYEVIFFGLVLSLGMIYMLVITPLSGPDEHYHYFNAYRYSNYLMGMDNPELIYEDYSQLVIQSNVEGGYVRFLEDFGKSMPKTTQFGVDNRVAAYPLAYTPQMIGILIGRLLNRNFITIFELGRFFNLLFYAICVYVSVKNIPRFKVLMGIISMMPMALHQAASFSSDAFINGFSFVLIAYAFKMIWEEGFIQRRDIIVVIVVATLLAAAKVIYCSIFLLYFLIPSEHFSEKNGKYKMLCAMIASAGALIIFFQLSFLQDMIGTTESTLNWEGQENYTLSFVFDHPLKTVKIFWNTFILWIKIWLRQAVGASLSGLSLHIDKHVISAYLFAIVIAAFDKSKESYALTLCQRFACAISGFSIILLSMAGMFLLWTSNTRETIEGVQGRYLIPAIPLLTIMLTTYKIKISDHLMRYAVILAGGLNVLVIAEVLRLTLHSIIAW